MPRNENVDIAEINDHERKEFVGLGTLWFAFGQRAIDAQDHNRDAHAFGDGILKSARGDIPFKIYVIGYKGFGFLAWLFGQKDETIVKAKNWIQKTFDKKKREYDCHGCGISYNPNIV